MEIRHSRSALHPFPRSYLCPRCFSINLSSPSFYIRTSSPPPTANKSNKSTSPDSVPTATNRGARGQKSIQSTADSTFRVNFGFGSTPQFRVFYFALPSSSSGLRKSHTQTRQSAPPVIIQSSNSRISAGASACCVEIFKTQ